MARQILLVDAHRAASAYLRLVDDELVPAVRAAADLAVTADTLQSVGDDDR